MSSDLKSTSIIIDLWSHRGSQAHGNHSKSKNKVDELDLHGTQVQSTGLVGVVDGRTSMRFRPTEAIEVKQVRRGVSVESRLSRRWLRIRQV